MDSDPNHQRVEEDRLSNLPVPLITHILSLLPTKYAVRTSSLSSFWKRQWTTITQLRLDDTLAPEATSTPETRASFVKFVYRVLFVIRVCPPDVFQLNCSQDYGDKKLFIWILMALNRHIRHIDLSFSNAKFCHLPKRLFSSRNLVVLKLDLGFSLNVPLVVSLDSLKILHLAVMFLDNDSLSRLVSSCPLLEELKMKGSVGENVNEVKISSVGLKRLILIGLVSPPPRFPYSYEVVLSNPGLQYLELRDCHVPISYSMEILHCLDRAQIDVVHHHYFLRQPIIRAACLARMRHTMTSLAIGISQVQFLYLSKKACKALYHGILCKLPKFPRLIELKMYETHWKLLTAFLETSPELASLSFRFNYRFADQPLVPTTIVPFCMLCNLKIIKIKNFKGQQMELEIVRYFLENSICLNKLLICYPLEITKEEKAEISEKVLILPRASTSCVVLIT